MAWEVCLDRLTGLVCQLAEFNIVGGSDGGIGQV